MKRSIPVVLAVLLVAGISGIVNAQSSVPSAKGKPAPCFKTSVYKKVFDYDPWGRVTTTKGFEKGRDAQPILVYELRFTKSIPGRGYEYNCYPKGPALGEYAFTTFVVPFAQYPDMLYYPVPYSKKIVTNLEYKNVTLPNGGVVREAINEEELWSRDDPPKKFRFRVTYYSSGGDPLLMSIEQLGSAK